MPLVGRQERIMIERTRISKVLNPLLVAVPRETIFGPASIIVIWRSRSVSSCSRTRRMVSSTSIRNLRGPEQLFSSWDILRGLRCRSSWNAGRLGPLPVDYNGVKTTQDHSKVNPYGAICSRATMILRSTVVHGRIGINGALLVLWIADEVHSWWVIEERSHCLET